MFKLGLIINPVAGVGGPPGLKGSDNAERVDRARQLGAVLRSSARASEALKKVQSLAGGLTVYCFDGAMGGDVANALGLAWLSVGRAGSDTVTTAKDTVAAAVALRQSGVDLIMFAGGDGTARDVYRAVGNQVPVLGVPAGVKMHSGVYAVSPQAAGEILLRMINGKLVDLALAEVRDIDEEAFSQGQVRASFFGELLVPREGHFLQQVKSGGREVEELVLQDIAADFVESMEDDCLYLIGPGTTPRAIMQELGLDNTLLGVDVILNGSIVALDVGEQQILQLLAGHTGPAKIVITAIGGQGHILGRGNQQLSPQVIKRVGLDHLVIIASKTKITELQGRPLLVDSNDSQLDKALSGYRRVITGYHDAIIYPVGGDTKTYTSSGPEPQCGQGL